MSSLGHLRTPVLGDKEEKGRSARQGGRSTGSALQMTRSTCDPTGHRAWTLEKPNSPCWRAKAWSASRVFHKGCDKGQRASPSQK